MRLLELDKQQPRRFEKQRERRRDSEGKPALLKP